MNLPPSNLIQTLKQSTMKMKVKNGINRLTISGHGLQAVNLKNMMIEHTLFIVQIS